MELLDALPARIWRMLIPPAYQLFHDDVPKDELVFYYRDKVYFVNSDGSVISMPKPPHLPWMGLAELLEQLATSDDTYDFDDNGEFDYGSILLKMGYLVPAKRGKEKAAFRIEIVNMIAPQAMVTRYELKKVSFSFALYHALMRCHELNKKSDWEFEHEVKRISKVERYQAKDLQLNH
jgi:hypothetical protein